MAKETINLNPIKFGHGVAKSMASAIRQNLEYYMPFTSESIGNVAETAFDIVGFISENRPDRNSRNDSNIVKAFTNRTARAAKTLLHDVSYGDLDFTETRNSMIKYINKHSHDEFAFDFDDGEVDSDEDNDFEGESSFTVEDFAEGLYESTSATIGAVEVSTRTLAKTTVKSNAVLGDRLISNNMANMAQMMQMGNAINTNISGINANLASLVEYNNNTMNGFIENTIKHFNKVESFMDEVLKRYNRADEDEKRKKEIEANRRKEAVFDGLHINIGNAARKAIESLDAELGNSGIITGTAGLLLSILGGGNTPKWFQGAGDASTISQWIQIINPTKLLADAFLPNLKQAGQLDKLMKGAMASFKKKLTADKDNGGFFSSDSFLGRLFGSIFGNDDFRFGKRYENKEASWMSSDSKALQLIPNKMDETQNLIQKLTKVTENIEEILAHSMTNALDLNKYVLNFNKDMLAFHKDMLDNNGNPPSGGGGGQHAASINRITQRNAVIDYHRKRNYNVTKEMTRRRIQNKHDYEDLEFDKLVFDEKQGRMVSSSEMLADYYAKKQSALGIRDFSSEIEDLISKHGSVELSDYDLKEANEKLADLIDAINSGDIDYFDDEGNLDADAILQELNDNVLEGLDDLQISGLYAAKFIGWLYEKNDEMKKKSAAFQDEVMSNPVILSILKEINPKFNPYDITDMDDIKAILSEDFSGNNAQYAQIARTLTTDQKRSMRSRAKYANAELGKSREASERLATYSNVISAFESGRMKLFDDASIQSDWRQYLQDHYNTTDVFTAFQRGGSELESMLDAKAVKEIKRAIQTKEAMSESSKYQKQSYRSQKLSRNPINWAFGALNDTLTDILSDVFTDFNSGEYKKAGKGVLGIFSSRTLSNIANAYGDRKITYTPGYDDNGNPVAVKIYDLKEHPGEVLIVRADGYDEGWEPDPYFEKVVRYNERHGGYEWDEERQLFVDKDGKRSDLQYNPYVRPDLRVFEDSGSELEGHAQGAMRIDRDKVVQVHEGEMILDASLSDKVRDNFAEMIKAGGFTKLDHRSQKELIDSISQSGDQFKGREMEVINAINTEINRHNIQNIRSEDLSRGSPVFIKTESDDTLYTSFIKKTHEMAANIAIIAGAKLEEFSEKREEREKNKASSAGKTLKDKLIGTKGENGELTGGYFSERINGIKSGFSDSVIKPMKDQMHANALTIARNEGMNEAETEEFLKNCDDLIDGLPKGVAGGLVGLVMGGPLVGLLGGLFASNKVVRELVFGKIVKGESGRHVVVGGMFGEFTSKLAKVGDDMMFNFKNAFKEVSGNLKTGFSLFVKHITNGVNDAISANIDDFFAQVNGSKEKKSFLAELFAGIKKAAYNVADTASDVAMDALSIGSKLVFNTAKIPFNMVAGLLGGKEYRSAKREQRRERLKEIYNELVANDARMGIKDITPGLINFGKGVKKLAMTEIHPGYNLGVNFAAMDKGWMDQSLLYRATNAISSGAGKVKEGAKSAVDKLVSGVERLNESFGGNFLKNILQAIGGTIIPIGASMLTGNPLPAIIGLPLVAGNTVLKQAIGTGVISAALAVIKKLPTAFKTRTTGVRTFFRNRLHAVKQGLGINDDNYYLKTMHDSTAMQGVNMLGDLGIDPDEYMRLKKSSDLTPEEWDKLAEYEDAIKSGWNINDKARYNELKQQEADFEAASVRKRYGGLNKGQYDRLQELNKRIDSGNLSEAERNERDGYLKLMEDYDAGADIELINNWQKNALANKREMFEKGWNSRDTFKANNPGFYKNRVKALDAMMDNPFAITASKFNNELRDLTVEDVQKMFPEISKEQAESIVHQYKNERFDLRKQIKKRFGSLDQMTFEEHADEIRAMLAGSDTIGKSKAALSKASDAELRSFILNGDSTTVEEKFRDELLTKVTTIAQLLDGTAPQFMDNLRQLVGLSPKHEETDNSNKYNFSGGGDEEEIEELMNTTGISREQAEQIVSAHRSGRNSFAANPDLNVDHSSNPTNVAFADIKTHRSNEVNAAIDEITALKNEGVDFDKLNDPEYQLGLDVELFKRAKDAIKRKNTAVKAYNESPDNISMSMPTGAPVDISEFMPGLNITPHAEGVLNIAKNEIAQLHAGEAVLDAETAKSFRSGLFGGMGDAKESLASIFSDMKSGIGELVGVFKGDKTASGDAKKSFLDQMKESFASVGTKMTNAVFGSGLIPINPLTGKPDLAKIGARLIALIGGAVLLGPVIGKVMDKLAPVFEPIFNTLGNVLRTGFASLVGLGPDATGEEILWEFGRKFKEGWYNLFKHSGAMQYEITTGSAEHQASEDATVKNNSENKNAIASSIESAGADYGYNEYNSFTTKCSEYFGKICSIGTDIAAALNTMPETVIGKVLPPPMQAVQRILGISEGKNTSITAGIRKIKAYDKHLTYAEKKFIYDNISSRNLGIANVAAGDYIFMNGRDLGSKFTAVIYSLTRVQTQYDTGFYIDTKKLNTANKDSLSKGERLISARMYVIDNAFTVNFANLNKTLKNARKTTSIDSEGTAYDSYSSANIADAAQSAGNGIGYGFMQNDPRWANMGYGRFKSGNMSTMGSGGCGPTAMSNVYSNLTGRTINPAQMARFSQANGYNAQGGTSAGLFTSGARKLGLRSNAIGKNGRAIGRSVRNGNNVIIAGKNGAYTKAGHIMSVRGVDGFGNAIVDDPLRRGARRIPMSKLTKGMTHAWSIGHGNSIGYGEMVKYPVQWAGNTPYSTWSVFNGGATFNTNGGAFGFEPSLDSACIYKSLLNAYINAIMGEDETFDMYANTLLPKTLIDNRVFGTDDTIVRTSDTWIKDAAGVIRVLNNLTGGNVTFTDLSYEAAKGNNPFETIMDNLASGNPIVFSSNTATRKSVNPDLVDIINYTPNDKVVDPDPKHDMHGVVLAGLYKKDGKEYVVVDNPGSGKGGQQLELIETSSFKNAIDTAVSMGNKYAGADMLRRIYVFNKNSVKSGGYDRTAIKTASYAKSGDFTSSVTNAAATFSNAYEKRTGENPYATYKATHAVTTGSPGMDDVTSLIQPKDHATFGDYLADLVGRLAQYGSNIFGTFLTGDTSGLFNVSNSTSSGYTNGGTITPYMNAAMASSNYTVNPTTRIVNYSRITSFIKAAYDNKDETTNSRITKYFPGKEVTEANYKAYKKYTYSTDTSRKYTTGTGGLNIPKPGSAKNAIAEALAASDKYIEIAKTIPNGVELYTWILAMYVKGYPDSVLRNKDKTFKLSDTLIKRVNADAELVYNKFSNIIYIGSFIIPNGGSIDGFIPPISTLSSYLSLPDWARAAVEGSKLYQNPGVPDYENAINYSAAVTPIGEVSVQFPPKNYNELEQMYFRICGDGQDEKSGRYLPSFGRSGFHFGPYGGYPGDAVFTKLMAHPDANVASEAQAYYNSVRSRIESGGKYPNTPNYEVISGSKDFLNALIQAEDATNIELKTDYFKKVHNANPNIMDPRIYALAGDVLCINPSKASLLKGVNTLELARNRLHGVADWAPGRVDGVYGLLTSGSGTINGATWSMPPYASSIGNGDAGYNMRDNIHMYTDDIYMGDADHPMHVTMDNTSVTSRLDKLVELVDTALNGKPEPVAGTSNAKTLGMGKGETKPTQQISSSKGYSSLGQQDKLSQIHNRIARRTRVGTNYNQM